MILRIVAFLVCQAAVIACAISAYDLPGWSNMDLSFQLVIGLIAVIATLIQLILVLVSDEYIAFMYQHKETFRRWNVSARTFDRHHRR